MDRRQFITWSAGGALMLAVRSPAVSATAERALTPWIRIAPDGQVTLITTVSDMGQGARTGQVQVLADELDIAWDAIAVEMAPDREPFRHDGGLYSGGSQSIRTRYDILRLAGATVRAQLTAAGAARWGVLPAACEAELGVVRHRSSGRSLTYGELAFEASGITPLDKPPLKPASARRYVGKPMPVLGMADRVNGRASYGIDLRLPGMLHASIRQAPVFGARLIEVEPTPALAITGVRKVVKLPGAVAVIADNTWAAFKGVLALDPKWTTPELRSSSATLGAKLAAAYDAASAVLAPSSASATRESLRAAYASAPRKLERTYELPFLSHAAMEPMNATARVTVGEVEIWAPCQDQTGLIGDVAQALGRPIEQIVLHTTLIGGGFGRRLKSDYAVLAALVAREVEAPVQLVWTREEDMSHDFYRPRASITYKAVLPADGTIAGIEMVGATTDDVALGGSGPNPYTLGPFTATQTEVKTGVPVGAWRSVDPSMTVFAKESFLDECAHEVGADPLEYRRRFLGSNSRARRVLDAAAEKVGWSKPPAPGVGRGLAMLQSWDSHVAHAIEVKVEGTRLRVVRIVVAADLGVVINPQQARAQFEGGALMGLSAALAEAVTVTEGQTDQTNFDRYRLLRMREAPPVEVLLFETADVPLGGAGEPPVPGVAPALTNAIFAACGKRVRALPIASAGFEIQESRA